MFKLILILCLTLSNASAFDHIARLSYRPYQYDLLMKGQLEFKNQKLDVIGSNTDRYQTTILRTSHQASYGLIDQLDIGFKFAWTFIDQTKNTESSDGLKDQTINKTGIEDIELFSSYRFLNQNNSPFNWDLRLALSLSPQSLKEADNSSPKGNATSGGPSFRVESKWSKLWDIFEVQGIIGLDYLGERTGQKLLASGDQDLRLSSRLDLFFSIISQWGLTPKWYMLLDLELKFVGSEDKSIASTQNQTTSYSQITLGTEVKYLIQRNIFTAAKIFFQKSSDYQVQTISTNFDFQSLNSVGIISSFSIQI